MLNLAVKRIINRPITSNCYIIHHPNKNDCIIIDPGTNDCAELICYLDAHDLTARYILLTHEHFDHIWGINRIKEIYGAVILCSKKCAEKIVDIKKNLSVFYDQVGFSSYPADIDIEDINYQLSWHEVDVRFVHTPGHTDCSICIYIDNNLFTGDTIIKDTKTVVKCPSGDKSNLRISLETITSRFGDSIVNVYPGHGPGFILSDIDIKEYIL